MIMSTTGIIISHPQPQNKSLIIAKWIHYYYLRAERLCMVDLGWVWIARLVFGVCVFPSFFFFARVCESAATVHVLFNEQ